MKNKYPSNNAWHGDSDNTQQKKYKVNISKNRKNDIDEGEYVDYTEID